MWRQDKASVELCYFLHSKKFNQVFPNNLEAEARYLKKTKLLKLLLITIKYDPGLNSY